MAAERSGQSEIEHKKSKKAKQEILWLLAIFFLAVVMRTIAVLSRQMIQFDEASYARMAENLLLGHAPWDITGTSTTHFSILYPLVTASFTVAIRSYIASGYAVSILFGSLLILPVYLFGKVMWNDRIAKAAAALVAVLPVLVDKSSIIDGQNLFAFWILCAMFFGYRMQFTKRCMCGMLAGTCLGIAYLDDPTALYYLVVLLPLLVYIGYRQEVSNYANKAAVHFILMFLLFAIPNIIFLSWENKSFTLSDRPMDELYAAVHNLKPETLQYEQQMLGLDSSGELVLPKLKQGEGLVATLVKDPLGVITALLKRDYNYYLRHVETLIPVWLIPLIGLGVFKTAWSRREALKYGYFALVMVPLLTLPLKWGDVRFILPYMGIVMLWVAKGWINLEKWSIDSVGEILGRKGKGSRAVRVALAVLILVPVAALSLWTVARTDYPLEYKWAGQWLKEQGGSDIRVMSREASTAYYGGGTLIVLPYASLQDVLDYAKRQQVDYLVISRPIVEKLRPQLKELLEPDRIGSGLKEVYRLGAGTDRDTIIYKLEQ